MRRWVEEAVARGDMAVSQTMSGTFDQYFHEVYQERWPDLREALASTRNQVRRLNRFADLPEASLPDNAIPFQPNCYPNPGRIRPEPAPNGLLDFYMMDLASVIVAEALEVRTGDRVLDLCAAPGGKALVLAEQIGSEGQLIANERSANRRAKMKSLLESYVPPDVLSRVRVTGHDGMKLGMREKDCYDRILVDAPCSSERHLIGSPHMKLWKPSRTRMMATRQHTLLCSALMALKPGGRLVYSTCSLSPVENDHVIDRFMKKRAGRVRVERWSSPMGEPTRHGHLVLPDVHGYGPMYFCVLHKEGESGGM